MNLADEEQEYDDGTVDWKAFAVLLTLVLVCVVVATIIS